MSSLYIYMPFWMLICFFECWNKLEINWKEFIGILYSKNHIYASGLYVVGGRMEDLGLKGWHKWIRLFYQHWIGILLLTIGLYGILTYVKNMAEGMENGFFGIVRSGHSDRCGRKVGRNMREFEILSVIQLVMVK